MNSYSIKLFEFEAFKTNKPIKSKQYKNLLLSLLGSSSNVLNHMSCF